MNTNKIKSFIFYMLSIVCATIFIIQIGEGYIYDIQNRIKVTEVIIFIITFCLLIHIAGIHYLKYKKNSNILNINLKIYTLLYVLIVIFFTSFNRGIGSAFEFNTDINLIPFATIYNLINNILKTYQFENIVMIIGNLLIIVPLAYLMPKAIKKCSTHIKFSISIIVISFLIEIIQNLLGAGIFDIDDIILNSAGPIIFYNLFNKGSVEKVLDKYLLNKKYNINKKDVSKIIITSIMFFFSFSICLYLYWYHVPGDEINIINTSKQCTESKKLIYENELFKYYYNCKEIDKAYINIKRKYFGITFEKNIKLEDIKNNYYIDIDVIRDLKNISYESKLKSFVFKYEKNVNLVYEIDDKIFEFVDIIYDTGDGYEEFNALIKPIKKGKTKFKMIAEDLNTYEKIEEIEFEMIIDDKGKIKYKKID